MTPRRFQLVLGLAAAAASAQCRAFSDAIVDHDGGANNFSDVNPPGAGWCNQQGPHSLCDDFDAASPLALWPDSASRNGAYRIDSAAATSVPGSFLATIAPLATNNDVAEVYIAHTFPASASHVRLSFDILAEALAPAAQAAIVARIGLSFGGKSYQLNLETESNGSLLFGEYADPGIGGTGILALDYPTGSVLRLREWNRITIDATLFGPSPSTSISVGSKLAIDRQAITPTMPAGTLPTVSLGGIFVRGPSQTWQFRYDNVIVDVN